VSIIGPGELLATNKGSGYFIVVENSPNITIKSVSINGNNLKSLGIDIHNSPDGILEEVKIKNIFGDKNNWSAGVRLRKNNNNFRINKVELLNIKSSTNAAVGIFIMSYENEGFSENVRIENSLLQDINSPR